MFRHEVRCWFGLGESIFVAAVTGKYVLLRALKIKNDPIELFLLGLDCRIKMTNQSVKIEE